MTFFLANKNILKNIKSVFNNCGLNIEKIILKSFVDGINLLTNDQLQKNFTILRLEQNRINISLFKNKSFVFTEDFNFGFNLIIKDISKLCSLKISEVENFLKKVELINKIEKNEESYLEKEYFFESPFRKIKYQLIFDIITARLEEFFEICYKKNVNIKNLRNNDKLYVYVESDDFYRNIQYVLEKNSIVGFNNIYNNFTEQSLTSSVTGACELISKGWEKEAIPIANKKKSFISGFFSKLFS
jgi:cell division ATPase FtsA